MILTYHEAFPTFIDRVLGANDEEMVDYPGSRANTRLPGGPNTQPLAVAEKLSVFYESLRDIPGAFSRRAGCVLGQARKKPRHPGDFGHVAIRGRQVLS
jgi:hypothetical protein